MREWIFKRETSTIKSAWRYNYFDALIILDVRDDVSHYYIYEKTVINIFHYQASKSHLLVIKVNCIFIPRFFWCQSNLWYFPLLLIGFWNLCKSMFSKKPHLKFCAHLFLALYTKLDKYNYTIFGNCTNKWYLNISYTS